MAATVIIGCNIPSGITLDVRKEGQPLQKVTLRGNAEARRGDNNGLLGMSPNVAHGFGMTTVDADFWEQWKAQNQDYAPFVNGSIYEAKSVGDAKAHAREIKDDVKSGMEPIDPAGKGDSGTLNEMPKDIEKLDGKVAA